MRPPFLSHIGRLQGAAQGFDDLVLVSDLANVFGAAVFCVCCLEGERALRQSGRAKGQTLVSARKRPADTRASETHYLSTQGWARWATEAAMAVKGRGCEC